MDHGDHRCSRPLLAALLALGVGLPSALAGPLDALNEAGFGHFDGKLQLLAMRRQFLESGGGLDASAGTLALTLGYETPAFHGLSLGVEGIACPQLFEAGSHPAVVGGEELGQGWWILNDGFHSLEHAYLDVDFSDFGLEGTKMRVGRQPLAIDFFPAYPIRQKAQAIEGLVLETGLVPGVGLKAGFFSKFSSWSTRDNGDLPAGSNDAALSAEFESVSEVLGLPYDSDGTLFVSADLKPAPALALTVYDVLLQDIMNVIGLKAAFAAGPATLKLHAILESSAGKFEDETGGKIDATLLDAAVAFKLGPAALEPGYLMVAGDKAENNFQAPFRTSLVADPLLLWYPRIFSAGAGSLYLKATSKLGAWSLYGLYVRTSHDDSTGGGATDQEVNVVVGHPLVAGVTATVKLGYGDRDNDGANGGGPDASAIDTRLFLTWTF